MLPELARFALILAFVLSLIQASVPLVGVYKNNINVMRLSKSIALCQCFFVGVAFFILGYCFLTNDFTVAYVAANSNLELPLIYKFCAIWGAHEGSLLLWIFILTLWMAAVALFSKSLPVKISTCVLVVMSWIAIGFYLFILCTSDPFARYFLPIQNGADLNPILQDPGLAIHPPILYMGYVGFSVAFAFAITALMEGKLDQTWARWARPWTQIAWCFLTLGIILGSWWSYRELGWGGFWFWDPVENASFLPWLIGTALMHSLAVTEKRNSLKAWNILLAISAFSLSLLGTFLVRSGVLISVHAFSSDPSRGVFLLRFLAVVVGLSLFLHAWRSNKIQSDNNFNFASRETMILINNILLFIAMCTVLLGTLYPLIIDSLGMGKISVGAPYFNLVFLPILFPLLFFMGIGPLFSWKNSNPNKILLFSLKILLLAVVIEVILFFIIKQPVSIPTFIILLLAIWLILMTASHIKFKKITASQIAMILAHAGLAIAIIGILLSSVYSHEKKLSMRINNLAQVGDYEFKLISVNKLTGPNYSGAIATLFVSKNNTVIAILHPELRVFSNQAVSVAKTSIDIGIFRDLYVALGGTLSDHSWALRIYVKPFVRWIWAGGLLMVLGGFFAVWDRRYRNKLYEKN